MITALGEIERYKKSRTWINIESHSGIDSFLFNREYELKDQKLIPGVAPWGPLQVNHLLLLNHLPSI